MQNTEYIEIAAEHILDDTKNRPTTDQQIAILRSFFAHDGIEMDDEQTKGALQALALLHKQVEAGMYGPISPSAMWWGIRDVAACILATNRSAAAERADLEVLNHLDLPGG